MGGSPRDAATFRGVRMMTLRRESDEITSHSDARLFTSAGSS
jgi:hypothetical protein